MSISDHSFGSSSTDLKLAVVEGYIRAFTTALRGKYKLWYIDAFAGTGERTEHFESQDENLLGPATAEKIERHRGSAKIAIEVQPKFDRLVFIETNARHCAALEILKANHPNHSIEIKNGTADVEIRNLLQGRSWKNTRGVMFLDPYGMQVSWDTLKEIRKTDAIDVWYLVSLSGLFRQAALEAKKLDQSKRAAIDRMVGTDAWQTEWYQRTETIDLFGGIDEQHKRTADVQVMQEWFGRRLHSLFPTVLKPMPLKNSNGVTTFALFFAISNPNPVAIGLASKIANHMLNAKAGSSSQVRPR